MDINEIRSLSFEDSYERLDEIIQRLEDGSLSLEESVALYEEGVQLARHCGSKLDDAELRVMELLNSANDKESAAS